MYYVRQYGNNHDLFLYINDNILEKVKLFGNKHKEKLIFSLYSNAFNLLKCSMIPYRRFKITPRWGRFFSTEHLKYKRIFS